MNLRIFHVDGVPFVVSPYQAGIHIREDVFRRQFCITCAGQIEYPEDDPIYGTYWMGATLDFGECGLIEEAMALATAKVDADRFDLGDDTEALGFSPEFITVHDDQGQLVLAGRVCGSGIEWCPPASSRAEADRIRRQIDDLQQEASFEHGWDNYETAKGLRRKARALGGRLVDPRWRDHATAAISIA